MTTQQYYEHVRKYFTQPDAKFGMDDMGNCVLWDEVNDRKCAVGCAIPEKDYDSDMEGYSIYDIKEAVPELFEVNSAFLRDTQTAHDRHAMSPYWLGQKPTPDVQQDLAPDVQQALDNFIIQLDNLARDYGLKVVQ